MAMKHHNHIAAGVAAGLTAICCAAPVVVAAIGAVGLIAWLGEVVVPALVLGAALAGFAFYRRQRRER